MLLRTALKILFAITLNLVRYFATIFFLTLFFASVPRILNQTAIIIYVAALVPFFVRALISVKKIAQFHKFVRQQRKRREFQIQIQSIRPDKQNAAMERKMKHDKELRAATSIQVAIAEARDSGFSQGYKKGLIDSSRIKRKYESKIKKKT